MRGRITPAGAGKTEPLGCLPFFVQDHPRRCGENFIVSLAERAEMGSPPQVRGKRSAWEKLIDEWRITPAGAGKTGLLSWSALCRWDHPRRCGENAKGNPY